MSSKIPLDSWMRNGGLGIIKFPISTEYSVLAKVLQGIDSEGCVLIHSKPLRSPKFLTATTVTVDATGHALTARTALRQRISASEDVSVLDSPEDIQATLSQLYKLRKQHPEKQWWIWWSPSDLIAHDVDEKEILRCLRAIAKEFADVHFVALVAKEVHSREALARIGFIAEVSLDIEPVEGEKVHRLHHWHVEKHPGTEIEGVEVVA
jgi:hypothetical protein